MHSPTFAAKVPSITALRQELNYGDSQQSRCDAFYDDVRVFRKNYHTNQGMPGNSFNEWRSREHQLGLREMVDAYLDRDGKGLQFWPENPTSPNYNSLQYPTAAPTIKRLIKQLFFRLNVQQYRNNKYKQRRDGFDNRNSLQKRGFSSDDPIDVDSRPADGFDGDPSRSPVPSDERYSMFKFSANKGTSVPVDPALSDPTARTSNARQPDDDPYAGPDSREPSQSAGHSGFRAFSSTSRDDQGDSQSLAQGSQAKRVKIHSKRPSNSSPKRGRGRPAKSTWTSPRGQRTRRDANWATNEQVQAALRSPTLSPIPTPTGGAEASQIVALAPMAQMVPMSPERSRFVTLKLPSRVPEASTPVEEPAMEEPAMDGISVAAPAQTSSPPAVSQSDSHCHTTTTPTATDAAGPRVLGAVDQPSPILSPHTSETVIQPASASGSRAIEPGATATQPEPASAAVPEYTKKDEREDTLKKAPNKKPIMDMTYKVILSRGPPLECEEWTPSKGLRKMSLAQFIEEMPLEIEFDTNGLLFTFLGPDITVKGRVYHGGSKQFESMKQSIDRVIRVCIAQRRDDEEILRFELQVETIKSGSTTAGGEKVYEGELDDY